MSAEIDLSCFPIHRRHNSPDPGKTYVWALMDYLLRDRAGSVGIDAACDFFKSFKYFRTERYVGVDCNKETLIRGMGMFPQGEALLSRLENLELTENSADVILSTHTLQYFAPEQIVDICAMFTRAVKSDGLLLVHVPNNECVPGLQQLFDKAFHMVQRLHVGHLLSRIFVKLFCKIGVFGNTPLYNSRPIYFLSRIVARTERRSSLKSSLGRQSRILFVCMDKKEKKSDRELILPDKDQSTGIHVFNSDLLENRS